MSWSTACPDWQERLLRGRPLVPELPLIASEAERAVRVFDRLRLPDVIGLPRLADAAAEWIRAVVRALFGAYEPTTHRRFLQEVFLLVPKKNGKSSFAAAIMLVALIVNRRPRAELLLVAPTKEIADIAFKQIEGMVAADPELGALFHNQRHIRTITHLKSGAELKIKAAETDVITGSKAAYTLIDETHVFAAKPRAHEVFVELRGALAARPDGFLFQITTQSKTPPAGVFKAELETARRVRDGKDELPLLAVLYELPPELGAKGAWKRPAHLRLVNPNLGRGLELGYLERELAKAEARGKDALALFASQHANVEIGVNLHADRWAAADWWEEATEPGLTLEALLARSEVVVVHVDPGGMDDLQALVVLGREVETRRYLAWCKAWAHRSVLGTRKEIAPRLLDFVAAGDLVLDDDVNAIDRQTVALILAIDASGLLFKVGLDDANKDELANRLAAEGFAFDRCVGIPQGWKLNSAVVSAPRRLANRNLLHGGQAILAWAVGNARLEQRGNATLITKQASGVAKIDPAMALVSAIKIMELDPAPLVPATCPWEDPGFTVAA